MARIVVEKGQLEEIIIRFPYDPALVAKIKTKEQHPEIRTGAAWALEELHNKEALNAPIESFAAIEENIHKEDLFAHSITTEFL